MSDAITMENRHQLMRVQHELVRRAVTVVAVEQLTPRMRRCVFGAESLKTFKSLGHDDHVKVFFPAIGLLGEAIKVGRDFTPRRIDAGRGLLTIDFALHDSGPATLWARHAKVGDTLELGGPKGSLIVPDDFDWYLLIGDETAIPAISRRLEELRPGVPVNTIIVVAGEPEHQLLQTAAAWSPVWVHREEASESDDPAIRSVLERMTFPPGDVHIWLAGESAMIRALRTYLIEDRKHPPEWLRAAGYWKRGAPGAHEKI